jgi:dTDP-4-dehydrorhamnose reductase
MRILVLGAQGQLGSAISSRLLERGHYLITPTHSECDVTDLFGLQEYIIAENPNVIINCAAMHDIAKCELQPTTTRAVNTLAVAVMDHTARKVSAKLFHVSTDMVFSSPGVCYEDTETSISHKSVYSDSKRASETLLRHQNTVVRVSALYGPSPCRGKSRPNFVEQVLRKVESGEPLEFPSNMGCSPGYCPHIADVFAELVVTDYVPRIVHIAPPHLRDYSWYSFARDIVKEYGSSREVTGTSVGTLEHNVFNLSTRYNWSLPLITNSIREYLEVR